MRLTALKVHNFRGVMDADVQVSPYALLVGPNNAGKSTLVDAIRCVYEKDTKYDRKKDWPHGKTADEESWVELTFVLSDDEYASLKEEYRLPDNGLRLRKVFRSGEKADKERDGYLYAYTPKGELADSKFYGAKNVQDGKIGDVIYIPAVSTVGEHTKLSGPSALRDLLTAVVGDAVSGGSAYKEFDGHFRTFADALAEEEVDGRSLNKIAEELNGMLQGWDAEFALTFKPPDAAALVKSLLAWDFKETTHGHAQTPEQFGSGFQRHFIYSLIQLGAQYAGKKASKKAKDFTPDLTLILFEEPEAFLHPPQQEILARSLRKLAEDDAAGRQVICATHSAHFVSKQADDIPALVRVRRESGTVWAHQVREEEWVKIADSNQQINEVAKKWPKLKKRLQADDMKPEMEAVKHLLWLNAERCGLFFGNLVLCVEGPTETAFINKLVGEGRIGAEVNGLYVLDCLGKYNIHRFMNLLSVLGIRHAVLHDDDLDKNEHAELNQLIKDSASEFTVDVHSIKQDLETLLGIPSAGADHRKPQHVLFLYTTDQIENDKVEALCGIVNGLISKS